MIKIRLIMIPFFFLFADSCGCSLFLGKSGKGEVVFAATEVGTPEGDKVTKDIHPQYSCCYDRRRW